MAESAALLIYLIAGLTAVAVLAYRFADDILNARANRACW